MKPLLEVSRLGVSFPGPGGTVPVVRDVAFQIRPGETVALVGESGSGKTVSALALTGLLPPEASLAPTTSIRIQGEGVLEDGTPGMAGVRGRTVGMVFQDPLMALNPVRRIGSQLVEVIRCHGTAGEDGSKAAAVRLLEEVGLPDPSEQFRAFPHQLSGGMRQRALIALALAGEPPLLVADEPTSALDATVQLQVLELLRSLQRTRELGVLLITHDLGVVRGFSDRVVVLYGGEQVEEGPTDNVLAAPGHPYTRALVEALPHGGAPKEPLKVLPGGVPAPADRGQACVFQDRCPLVRERCRTRPPSEPVLPGWTVRCWVAGEEGR